MTTATFEAAMRRQLRKLATDARDRGLSEADAVGVLGVHVMQQQLGAARAALKAGLNPIDFLVRSGRMLEIARETLADVMVEVYGATGWD